MSDKQDNEISACIDRLEREVALLRELSLPATAQILEMAILELRMALHAISEDELRAFTDFASRQSAAAMNGEANGAALGNGHANNDRGEPQILANRRPRSRGRLGRAS
jgi:hypothetical protein